MAMKLDGLFTPGGRFVSGSLTEKQNKDYDGNAIPEGEQAYFFGVAVPKTDPTVASLIGQIYQMACTDYAQAPLVMAQIQQGLAAKDFAWKIQDGDIPTYDRKTGAIRPIPDYYKGCYIFKFRTNFDVSCCDFNGRDIDRKAIKRGDYIDVMFNTTTNGKVDDTAGVYMNPVAVRLLGYGEAIQTGVVASSAFAGRAAAVPAGATQMPTAAGAGAMPGAGMPGNPAPGGMPMAPVQPPAGMPGASQGTASPGNPGHTPAPMAGMPGM